MQATKVLVAILSVLQYQWLGIPQLIVGAYRAALLHFLGFALVVGLNYLLVWWKAPTFLTELPVIIFASWMLLDTICALGWAGGVYQTPYFSLW